MMVMMMMMMKMMIMMIMIIMMMMMMMMKGEAKRMVALPKSHSQGTSHWHRQTHCTVQMMMMVTIMVVMVIRVTEVGVLAATTKYPSVLATSARLQISESKTSFLQIHIFVLCFQWWESARL